MNLWEEGKGGEGRVGERGWGGDGERVGREGGEVTCGREGGWGGRVGREEGEGRGGKGRGGEGRVGEGRGGEERGGEGRGGEGRGGRMTVIHILIGMFNSNPMIPQYLNNNLT